MKNKKTTIALIFALLISWALPVYCVLYNQLSPSYESALGVAFGFGLGFGVHLIVITVWLAIRGSRPQKREWIPMLASLLLMIILTAMGNVGMLSRMS